MSEIVKSIIMGIVQGATEFLPISSSGHLALMHKFLNFQTESNLFFDVMLHLATLIAVIIFFRDKIKDIIVGFFYGVKTLGKGGTFRESFLESLYSRLSLLIIVGSIPTAAIGLIFKDLFESYNSNLIVVGSALIVTSILLLLYEISRKGYKDENKLSFKDVFIIGIVQGIAIIPGISRSGSTIAAAKLLRVKKETAASFSFLLSIPAVGGAFLLKLKDLFQENLSFDFATVAAGFLASFITGYLCLAMLLWLIRKANLKIFILYCFIMGSYALYYALN
ncbi:MAG: hypothetical protein CR982_06010 [Candidatus Cloacimonadota bacterium]|nr:MAG: hypothetical protein CR982_06010 [Candidatus Cloacimonadota bacterium]PIE78074.1 MAG: hypothetical protein CSA15_09570 [Candidatus Delongbacteria bacterium]